MLFNVTLGKSLSFDKALSALQIDFKVFIIMHSFGEQTILHAYFVRL